MRLSNEFVVAAPIERTWKTLVDVPAGGWRGTIGDYAGTARLQDIDDDERIASFRAVTTDGVAAATLTSRLAPDDGATRVHVETDVRASGPVDRPSVEAALEQLSKRLEQGALVERDRPDPGPVGPGPVGPARTGRVDPDRTPTAGGSPASGPPGPGSRRPPLMPELEQASERPDAGRTDPDRTALVGIALLLALLIAAIVRGARR
jgi:carbon monoxide dehydrogenase subunit G